MPSSKFAVPGLAALALVAVSSLAMAQGVAIAPDPALAALSPAEMVEKRQALMKEDGGILRGAGALGGAEAVAAADHLIANFSNLTVLFPEGSIVGDSSALPAIWENWDAFQAILANAVGSAAQMRAAAEAGDAAAYGAAIRAIGGTCGQCHQQFRKPS